MRNKTKILTNISGITFGGFIILQSAALLIKSGVLLGISGLCGITCGILIVRLMYLDYKKDKERVKKPREGWRQKSKEMSENSHDELIIDDVFEDENQQLYIEELRTGLYKIVIENKTVFTGDIVACRAWVELKEKISYNR